MEYDYVWIRGENYEQKTDEMGWKWFTGYVRQMAE